jgi:hypothetical protein
LVFWKASVPGGVIVSVENDVIGGGTGVGGRNWSEIFPVEGSRMDATDI